MTPVKGYETKYHINWDGSVYSLPRTANDGRKIHGKWLTPVLDKDGYLKVMLYSGGRGTGKSYRISRLVAETFIQKELGKEIVNHKDGNKKNNHYLNLEWSTPKENTTHAWNTGLCKPYDRNLPYNKQGIIESNKRRKKQKVCGI